MPTSSDTTVQTPVLNLLTKTIYDSITPSNTELYAVDMEYTGNKVLITNSTGEIVESTTAYGKLDYLNNLTSDIQTQLNAKQATLTSGTNIKTINGSTILGSGNLAIDSLPSQSGQSGKYLTTDGTTASWGTISLSGYEVTTNKVTSLSSSSTDTEYPSAKCVYDLLGDVEALIDAL